MPRTMTLLQKPTIVMAAVAMLVAPLLVLAFASPARAHDGTSTVIYLDVFPDGSVEGQVEHPVVLLNELFDFDLDPDEASEDDIAATNDVMAPFNTASFAFFAEGREWPVTFTDTEVVETENRLYAAYNFELDDTFQTAPRQFEVTYTGVFDQVAGHIGYVVVRTDPQTGTFRNDDPVAGDENPAGTDFQTDLLTTDDTTSIVDLDDPNTFAALWATIDLGMEHIFIGTDHILFVLVLLLPAVMLFSLATDKWVPVPSFGEALWRVVKIASMFTIAHSITLTLGGLGIVELPSKLVETIIAISIIAAAIHNLRPIFANREHLIAFAFGIFHGFGFAGLLSDLGVGRGQRLLSLFGFNIGVEIGQIVIIILLFPALYLLRRTVFYPAIIRVGSVLLAAVAFIWAIERIFEVSLGIDDILDRFTKAPRVFLLIAAATIVAAGIRQVEASRGRLLPLRSLGEVDGDGTTEVREPELV